MTLPPKPRLKSIDNVVQLRIDKNQTERLIAELARFNDTAENFVKDFGYISEKFGGAANDFTALKKFAVKWLPWIVTAGAVFIPRLQDFLNKLPPFPH